MRTPLELTRSGAAITGFGRFERWKGSRRFFAKKKREGYIPLALE
jgi:hypothetical protein